MAPTVEKLVARCEFGEGPHWDEETQSLYFVDLKTGSINRYVPSTKKFTKASLDESSTGRHVSIIIPIRGQKNKFLVGLKHELAVVTWDGESDKVSETRIIFKNPVTDVQFNDGKCDPTGRLWIGTMFISEMDKPIEKTGKSSFYSFQGNNLKTLLTEVGVSNGLAFNVELRKMYYIDSFKGCVDEFDVDIEKGSIDNRKPIFTKEKHDIPGNYFDGMTIDADGNLWVAVMSGSRVIKIDPRKPETLLDTVILPTKQVTSMAFGGKNLDELYVTTGKPWESESTVSDSDGALFKITGLNTKGLPGFSVVL